MKYAIHARFVAWSDKDEDVEVDLDDCDLLGRFDSAEALAEFIEGLAIEDARPVAMLIRKNKKQVAARLRDEEQAQRAMRAKKAKKKKSKIKAKPSV